ncbi:MAG: hypothetical protein EOP09_07510 [Proteobacteria bacterium]|nr:MAG: hypothetical protein EOP09_07510 [Pseudomonadota bacterium]
MSLDITKLRKVRKQPGKTIAQCPACAETGNDSKGDHLIIYPDGKYGCVVTPGDSEHRKRIWLLAGTSTWKEHPFEFEVRPYQMPKKQLLKSLTRFRSVSDGSTPQ